MGQVQMEVQNDQMGDHGTKLERIEDDPYAFDDGEIFYRKMPPRNTLLSKAIVIVNSYR